MDTRQQQHLKCHKFSSPHSGSGSSSEDDPSDPYKEATAAWQGPSQPSALLQRHDLGALTCKFAAMLFLRDPDWRSTECCALQLSKWHAVILDVMHKLVAALCHLLRHTMPPSMPRALRLHVQILRLLCASHALAKTTRPHSLHQQASRMRLRWQLHLASCSLRALASQALRARLPGMTSPWLGFCLAARVQAQACAACRSACKALAAAHRVHATQPQSPLAAHPQAASWMPSAVALQGLLLQRALALQHP